MEEIESNKIKFWIKDGILFNEFTEPIDLTEDVVKEVIRLRHVVSNGEKQYWCTSFHNVKSMPKKGRDYTDKYGQDYLHASAAIINSHITKFIVNAFTMIKNPKIPFKAFLTKEEGIAWLMKVKAENESKK